MADITGCFCTALGTSDAGEERAWKERIIRGEERAHHEGGRESMERAHHEGGREGAS